MMRANEHLTRASLAAILISLIADVAYGQTVQPASTSSSGETAQLEDIVVSANRREERLQNVPIAVNAVTAGTALRAGVKGTEDLAVVVPSLVVQRRGNAAQPVLRGVGMASGDANAENSVALYVDGVYYPVTQGNAFDFNNIDRIEVLKGPQGTLFGRNATGGVVQIITREPSFQPVLEMSVGYANYNTLSGSLYASTALDDKIAADLALQYRNQRDGWGRNLTLDRDAFSGRSFSARSKLLLTPDELTRITIMGDYARMRNTYTDTQPLKGVSGDPRNYTEQFGISHVEVPVVTFPGPTPVLPLPPGQGYPGDYNSVSSANGLARARSRGASLHFDRDFGSVQMRSITAYRAFNQIIAVDADFSPHTLIDAILNIRARTFSQEAHLYSTPGAQFEWLVGAYYFRSNAGYRPSTQKSFLLFLPYTMVDNDNYSIASSYAIFGQGKYPISDSTNLTLGLRYTWDKAVYRTSRVGFLPNSTIPTVLSPQSKGTLTYDKPTWRVALDHNFTPDVLGYVSYNRGIKSGNFSVSVSDPMTAVYKPEVLDAYEIGLKTEWLNRRLRVNFSGFYYDYSDQQFQRITNGVTQTLTVDSVRFYGAELEVEARPLREITLASNLAWLNARIGNFPNAPAAYRQPNGLSTAILGYNAQGNRPISAPRFSGNFSASYRKETNIGTFDLTGSINYTSRIFYQVDNRLSTKPGALVNASLTWTNSSERFSASLWGRNLTDRYYYSIMVVGSNSGDAGTPAPPRTYGITLSYKM